jgi:WD40 repeat protein
LRDPNVSVDTLVKLKHHYDTQRDKLKYNMENFKLLEYYLLKNRLIQSEDINRMGHLELFDALNKTLNEQIRNVVICSANSNDLHILNLNTNVLVRTLIGHTDRVKCFVLCGPNMCITGSEDKCIKIWELSTGKCVKTLLGHSGVISALLIVNEKIDSSLVLASGSIDKTIKLWNLLT